MKKNILAAILSFAIVISCEKKQEEHAEHATTEQTASENQANHDDQEKSDEHEN